MRSFSEKRTSNMIFSLIVGIAIGIIAVLFILQNTALVTVAFLGWQFQGSLALILFVAVVAGAVMTLLFLLPSSIRDSLALSSERRKKKRAEEELLAHKRVIASGVATPAEPEVL